MTSPWVKAGRCDTNACVEAKGADGVIYVRSTLSGEELAVTREEWDVFVTAIKSGEFDEV